MEHVARAAEQGILRGITAHVALFQHQVRLGAVVCEVFLAPADQIVDDANGKTAREQQVHHVAADESGAAGDDRDGLGASGHAALRRFRRRTLK